MHKTALVLFSGGQDSTTCLAIARALATAGLDLVILEVGLPGEDGLSICRRLRNQSAVPIIMVTAKGAEIDTVVGLEVGADDYVAKPYRMRELVARMRAVMRRPGAIVAVADELPERVLAVGDLALDPDEHRVTLDGEDVLSMSVDERARAGMFLAMQYPVEVPGVSVSNFLRTSVTAVRGEAPKLRTWVKEMKGAMDALSMYPAFAERNVNEGFSGGEKKRHEIMQLELLKPKIAILDETDSGLDVDALKIVSEGVNRAKAANDLGVLLITHYTRILRYIKPDFVHVFANGRIVEEGGPELADKLEEQGYEEYVTK